MAEIDKNSIMDIISGLVSDDKKEDVSNILSSLTGGSEKEKNEDPVLFDTAQVMGQITNIMGKVGNAKNHRGYALLSALRPYIREERKTKLDSCMKILQAVTIINEFKKERS
jgi:hypothetical protein